MGPTMLCQPEADAATYEVPIPDGLARAPVRDHGKGSRRRGRPTAAGCLGPMDVPPSPGYFPSVEHNPADDGTSCGRDKPTTETRWAKQSPASAIYRHISLQVSGLDRGSRRANGAVTMPEPEGGTSRGRTPSNGGMESSSN
ncbi:hypothetical protein LX32DRAFT_47542 [Colletotrichum zoysiae]|uniref:Uncharacterized protein n=1 Tax=Colletotrichum zoysiae TaxID=1216348 RepID=A0AAD9M1R0_9PEZI|nr:hypothetical protein LX32DRAFT_47542 [Colletotrichum zoysiae]